MQSNGARTPKRFTRDDGPTMDVALPSEEWFDDMYGPMMNISDNRDDRSSHSADSPILRPPPRSRSATPQRATRPRSRPRSKPTLDEIVTIDEEGDEEQPQTNDNELEFIADIHQNTTPSFSSSLQNASINEDATPEKPIQSPKEMKKIILSQAQLKQLAKCKNPATFRKAVIGCYVRVITPERAEKFKDLIFIDQIIDVLELQTYQHFWFNRRLRTHNFGDFEIGQIHEVPIENDDELKPWFCYMQAKEYPLPTNKFIKQKVAELSMAQRESEADSKIETKVHIKRADLGKIVLSPDTLRSLSKLEFEKFRKVVTGCFVCVQAVRIEKPDDCQWHIVPVKDCTRGAKEYKLRGIAIVNYQLVFPFYGKYIIPWLRDDNLMTTDAGFRQWVEDMKSWNQPIPTLEKIGEKAAQLQMALNEVEQIPSYAQKKKQQKEDAERQKRAKLPIKVAKDLDQGLLSRQNLQKLAALASDDFNLFERILTGSFVRTKAPSSSKQFQIDQIRATELVELKPLEEEEEEDEREWAIEERISIELKFGGGTSLKELIKNASAFKVEPVEFDDWLRKMHNDKLGRPIPTYEVVEKKHVEIQKALESADKKEAEQKKANVEKEPKKDKLQQMVDTHQHSNSAESFRIPKRSYPAPRASQNQPNQWQPRKEVRETPGLRPGWMNLSAPTPRISQQQQRGAQFYNNQPMSSSSSTSSSSTSSSSWVNRNRLVSQLPSHINFVAERDPWIVPQQQRDQINQLLNSRLSRYDIPGAAAAIPGESPSTFFTRTINRQSQTISSATSQEQMERSLGFFHDNGSRIGTTSSFSADAIRRAIPNDRFSQLMDRSSSSSMVPSAAPMYGHYNTYSAAQSSSSSISSPPKRSRQYSPQPPPVQRLF